MYGSRKSQFWVVPIFIFGETMPVFLTLLYAYLKRLIFFKFMVLHFVIDSS